MAGPDRVRLKRARGQEPLESVVVEHQGKKARHGDYEQPRLYIRQKTEQEKEEQQDGSQAAYSSDEQLAGVSSTPKQVAKSKVSGVSGSGAPQVKERRVFHLRRPGAPESGIVKGTKKKRRTKDDGVATFVEKLEKRVKRDPQELLSLAESGRLNNEPVAPPPQPQKRPGRSSALKTLRNIPNASSAPTNGSNAAATDRHLQAMANSLHQFAIEEAEKEKEVPPKPKILSKPKLPPQRSRELHHQRVSQTIAKAPEQVADDDMDVDDDADYVYETYVLAPTSGTAQVDAQEASGEVGYLIITEEDQEIWESYIEDEPSDKDWNSDEDDENAEDWYGADYPDDELASDDEYDRNAYGYRAGGGGSDDEEWDEDTGAYSDNEYERQMNPFGSKKAPKQFEKYFNGVHVDDDDEE